MAALFIFSLSTFFWISFAVVAFATSALPTDGGIMLAKYVKICLTGRIDLKVLVISTNVKYVSPTISANVSTDANSIRNNGKSPIAIKKM